MDRHEWFIEGDISDCFGSLDHEILLSALAERIHDGRFLRLLRNMLTSRIPGRLGMERHAERRAARRGGHAPNAIDNFCFDVTLSYRRLERPRRGAAG